MNHLGDTNKMVSHDLDTAVDAEFSEQLECELNAANDRIKRLEEWKEITLEIERGWDANSIAKMLGGRLGECTRKIIQREVPLLLDHIKRLEKDSDRLDWLLKRGLAWRGCYNGHWLEGEWLYSSQYAIETIDKAKEAKP